MKAHVDLNKSVMINVLKGYGGLSLASRDTLDYNNFQFENMIRVSPRLPRYELRVCVWNDGAKRRTYGIAYLAQDYFKMYLRREHKLPWELDIKITAIYPLVSGFRLEFEIVNITK